MTVMHDKRADTTFAMIKSRDIKEWVKISGDRNPIHLDTEFARRHGFKHNFAHGLLCVLALQDCISSEIEEIATSGQCYLDYRFRKPVYVNEPNQIALRWREQKQIEAEIRSEALGEVKIHLAGLGGQPVASTFDEPGGEWSEGLLPDDRLHLGKVQAYPLSALNALQVFASKAYFSAFDPFSARSENLSGVDFRGKEVLHLRHQVLVCDRSALDLAVLRERPVKAAVWWGKPAHAKGHVFATANTAIRQGSTMLVSYKMSFRISAQNGT